MNYPNGSVPYGGDDDLALRAKRLACSAVNHHPRQYDGSWCWGYGYVCGRCHMYADQWSTQQMDARVKAVGNTPDQSALADVARWE